MRATSRPRRSPVQETVERLVQIGRSPRLPTFFECATAIAFELFRRASVELAVLEVGLGGRLDATNVISPMAAVITSIDFDHQDLLGETLESIAREKAGVIKPGIPVIVGPVAPGARAVIEATCRERGATFVPASERVRVTQRGGRTKRRRARATISLAAGEAPARRGAAGAAGPASDRQRERRVLPHDELVRLGVPLDASGDARRADRCALARPARASAAGAALTSSSTPRTTRPAHARSPTICARSAGGT